MRKISLLIAAALTAFAAAPAQSADLIPYPPVYEIPPVDYDLGGSFYLRGSIGAGLWTAVSGSYCACVATFSGPGYGFSGGLGVGYETGDGWRGDLTLDYLQMDNLASTSGENVDLKSGLFLINGYYDFMLDGSAHANGGFGAYVGAGLGFAKNYSGVYDAGDALQAWGSSVEAAAAGMVGVTYDMGNMVADVGYRGIYMNKVMNQPVLAADSYRIDHNWIHEIRTTLRYRF